MVRPQAKGDLSISPLSGAPDLAALLQAAGRGEKIFLCSEQAIPDLLAGLRSGEMRELNAEKIAPGRGESTHGDGSVSAAPLLTRRQKQVLLLALDGLSNREIAGRLGRAVRSVKACVSELLARLNAKNRCELISRAVKLGLIGPEGQSRPDASPAREVLRAKAAGAGR